MSSLKLTKTDRFFLNYLHTMVEMTQEVSVMKMQKIRESVLGHRTYMDGLLQIFQHVKQSHERELQKALEKRKQRQTTPEHPKKNVVILLSPSNKFSGGLTRDVFESFVAAVEPKGPVDKEPADIVVVGEIGKELFDRHFGTKQTYQFFPFKVEHPDAEVLHQLLAFILEYQNITVFTARFQSLALQEPAATNISGSPALAETAAEVQSVKGPEFLFEPSLDEIVTFFEEQVTASLFQQAIEESSLAHVAARVMSLESSVSAIEEEAKKTDQRIKLLTKRIRQKKQQQQLSSIRLWS